MKGRSRISMVWVPQLGFDPYCEGEWLPVQDEFTQSINSKKNFHKSYERISKNQKIQFSRKCLKPILLAKIYVIKRTKEVLKKIQEPIPFIKGG